MCIMKSRWLLSAIAATIFVTPAMAQDGDVPAAVTAAPPTAVPATTSGAADELAPGPLLEARKMLRTRIGQAKSEGIGTAPYVAALKDIEDEVKAGKTADEIRPRIESVARGLKDQLDRKQILKTQRPIPPSASQSAGGPMPSGPSGGGSGGSGLSAALGGGPSDTSALLDKLKDKLLNGGEIPDSLKQRVMQSEKGRKMMEKLGL
jgi:hypothetical protein